MAIPQQGVPAKPAQGAAGNAKLDMAKNALAGAKKFSQSVDPSGATAAKPQPAANPAKAVQRPPQAGLGQEAASAGAGLAAKQANVKQYEDATREPLPKMHAGGTVPEDGDYNLQKNETVTAAPAPVGRQSEYRKVYLQRKSGAPAESKSIPAESKDAPAIDKMPPAASKQKAVTTAEKVQDSKGE